VSAFIDEHRARFGVEPICRVLGVSASAFYQRATGQRSARRGKPWRTTTPDPLAKRPDLVQRDFTDTGPNRLWVGDLTYLRCWEGVVFFAFVLDAYSRRIVGWQFASHLRTELVLDALRMAIHQRGPGADVELVAHTDRGSQGGFKWSSQHLDLGGVDGQASRMDGGVDGSVADEVAGAAVIAAGGAAGVLA
jgi:putative transposase